MDIATMEPMVPEEASKDLEDEVVTLIAEANRLAGRVHPVLCESMGNLVRSMNCYYSNLIEGHDTHPRDIDRALVNDFSAEPKRRELQQEAIAHIHVQRLIDEGRDPDVWPASAAYAAWLHEEFCSRLPPEMLWVVHPRTGVKLPVVPGECRTHDVEVGRHLPPDHGDLPRFLARFDRAYTSPPLNSFRQIQAVGAVHHRFLWIHPFLDGNGRVGRLLIVLLLCQWELLPQPLLYLSHYFERHRTEYYAQLLAVSQQGKWEEWLTFFLVGVRDQSRDATIRIQKLQALREKYYSKFAGERKTAQLQQLVDFLLGHPIVNISQVQAALKVRDFKTAQRYIAKLQDAKILTEITGKSRNRLFRANEILRVIEEPVA